MIWPKKKPDFTPERQPIVEIVAHKDAHDSVVKKAEEANEYVRKLLKDENHFTLSIVLGIGGNELRRRKR